MEDFTTGTRGSADLFSDLTNFSYNSHQNLMVRHASKNTQGSFVDQEEIIMAESCMKSPAKGGIFELQPRAAHPVYGLLNNDLPGFNFNSGATEILNEFDAFD